MSDTVSSTGMECFTFAIKIGFVINIFYFIENTFTITAVNN